jgi:hypothetical protein
MRKILFAAVLVGVGCVGVFAEVPQLTEAALAPDVPVRIGLPAILPGDVIRSREIGRVDFESPVRIMNVWLQGAYLIEHDEERMKQGAACTHIYRVKNRREPVVTFHCTHLHRPVSERGTITLKPASIRPGAFELLEFQYQGSTDGHGVPQPSK